MAISECYLMKLICIIGEHKCLFWVFVTVLIELIELICAY
jgi:hypothetical protein